LIISENLTVTFANKLERTIFNLTDGVEEKETLFEKIVEAIIPHDRGSFAEAIRQAFSARLKSSVKIELE